MLHRFHVLNGAIVGTLVATMILPPAMLSAQPPVASAASAAAKPKPDMDYITPDAFAAVVAYPRAVMTSPAFEDLPIEVLSAAGKKELGFDPVEIEQAIAIAAPPIGGPPQVAVVLKMANPIGGDHILPPLWKQTSEDTLDGKTYRKGNGPMDMSIYQPDDKTLIVGSDPLLRKIVAVHASPAPGKLKTMLARGGSPDLLGVVLIEPLRPMANAGLVMAPIPPQLAGLRDVPNLVNYVAFKSNLSDPFDVTLSVRANDEAAAQQLEHVIDQAIAMGQQAAEAEMAKQEASGDPVDQAAAKYTKRLMKRLTERCRPVRKGATLTLSGGGSGPAQIATIGILIGLLLPAVNAAREAGRRAQSLNNMKQIMLAMANYESTFNSYPPQAICDAQGKPLLSWRVAILPYIDQDALYKQFHLDEPWDSPHNRTLIAAMPAIYRNPSSVTTVPGKANYLAVCGKGLMFDGAKGRKLTEITDGTSNTIAIVEADEDRAIEWTKPQDWDFDATRPLAGLGHAHPAGFCAGFVDGSVRFMSSSIDPTVFHALLTVAGGEAAGPP